MMLVDRLKIERIAKYEQEINQGDTYVINIGRDGATTTPSSVDESISGGHIQPVEFSTLEISNEKDGDGLGEFFNIVKYLEKMHTELQITMNIVNLPMGRTFSWLPDGRR